MANKSAYEEMTEDERAGLRERLRRVVDCFATRQDAATTATVSLNTLTNVLAGKSPPSALLISRLAQATGFAVDWLLLGMGPEKRDPFKIEKALAQWPEEKVQQVFAGISQARRQMLLVKAIEEPLATLYSDSLSPAHLEEAVDGAIDRVLDLSQDSHQWPDLAAIVVGAHRDVVASSGSTVPAAMRAQLAAQAYIDAATFQARLKPARKVGPETVKKPRSRSSK